jgi:hypothetical protein
MYQEGTRPDNIDFLGQGTAHVHYRIGSIQIQEQEEPLYLALRLPKDFEMQHKDTCGDTGLVRDIAAYEMVANRGEQTPYFAGLVTVELWGKDLYHLGMITEDATRNGSNPLKPENNGIEREYFLRGIERVFLDPCSTGPRIIDSDRFTSDNVSYISHDLTADTINSLNSGKLWRTFINQP